jgi:predicted DNA-binding transcriptional regulator YafY
MAEMTQLERAIRILQRLSVLDNVTINELYDLFDGQESKRTLQRTLASIESANVPLQIEHGAHNEISYSLKRAFQFTPMMLTADEVIAASLLNQFMFIFQDTSIGKSLEAVFDKMSQLYPSDAIVVHNEFEEESALVAFHGSGQTKLKGKGIVLQDLFTAILTRSVCTVRYKSKSFTVHPYNLLIHHGTIYAIVFVPKHNNWIYLALQRVSSIKKSEKQFERDAVFSLPEFLRHNFGIWHEPPEDVTIRFSSVVQQTITERIWHHSQKIEELENGDILLNMRVGISEELIAWILRWGEHAEVVKPNSLKERIIDEISKMQDNYKTGSKI